MSKLGVLAQLQEEKDREIAELAERGLLGEEQEPNLFRTKAYKMAIRKKGAGSMMKEALMEGASPEELKLLRQLRFVRGD